MSFFREIRSMHPRNQTDTLQGTQEAALLFEDSPIRNFNSTSWFKAQLWTLNSPGIF